jgi:hypothetical protein
MSMWQFFALFATKSNGSGLSGQEADDIWDWLQTSP